MIGVRGLIVGFMGLDGCYVLVVVVLACGVCSIRSFWLLGFMIHLELQVVSGVGFVLSFGWFISFVVYVLRFVGLVTVCGLEVSQVCQGWCL